MAPKRKIIEESDEEEDTEISFKLPPKKQLRLECILHKLPDAKKPVIEPRRSPNGFILPDPLPKGHVLVDNVKQAWTIGESIGLGGFGEIYSAARNNEKEEKFVVKVEPHTNGPLFTEIAFYLKCAKMENIQEWKRKHNLDHLGVPSFVASGSLVFNEKKFRFLVLPKYGMDLQAIVDSTPSGHFSIKMACIMAVQVINALEFIHSYGYVHKDIKGSNLLLGDRSRVFLVDFGLCSRYIQNDIHKPYIPDRRWAHEGTMEYTSRDCHRGVFSRRGDLEVLVYNFIEWVGGVLPWEDMQDVKPTVIQELKIKAFENKTHFLDSCFISKNGSFPKVVQDLLFHVSSLSFEEDPDYDKVRSLLNDELDRANLILDEVQLNIEMDRNSYSNISPNVIGKENEDPSGVGLLNLERGGGDIKKPRKAKKREHLSLDSFDRLKKAKMRQLSAMSLMNPTPAMLDQLEKMRLRAAKKNIRINRSQKSSRWRNLSPSPITPAMRSIIEKRNKSLLSNSVEKKSAVNNSHSPISSRRRKIPSPRLGGEKTSSSSPPSKRPRLQRSQTVPVLSTEDQREKSSFRNHFSSVMGVGLELIQGLSRSLFPTFKRS